MHFFVRIGFLRLVCTIFGAWQTDNEEINWSADRKLCWEDFKGEADSTRDYAAYTSYTISSSYTQKSDTLTILLSNTFVPNLSWVKANKQTPDLLAHEQLHFDIAELYARKTRKEFSQLSSKTNLESQWKKIYNKYQSELDKEQNRYDKETDYSRNVLNQKKWNNSIKKRLDSLSGYVAIKTVTLLKSP